MPTHRFPRRDVLKSAAALVPAILPAQRPEKPNFVLICTDDHGYRDLGCHGAGDLKTPAIDALAASGTRFTDWYSNAPVCAPSRAALLTGRYPQRAGVPQNGQALKPGQRTTASLLKPAGYATGLVGKWHLGSAPDTVPNAHGFDYFYGFHSGCVDYFSHRYYWGEPRAVNYHDLWRNRTEIFEDGQYLTERIAAEAAGFIERNRSNPFFLYVAFNAPHYPMHAPARYTERFSALAPERRTYAAMIAAVDDGITEIVRTLEQHGLRRDTLVIYLSDNGATREARAGLEQKPATAGNNGQLRGFKFSLFDGGMHVPCIMNWPGRIPAGRVTRELGMSMDVLPTILDAAGVQPPPGHAIDGSDILPVVRGDTSSPHNAIYWKSGPQSAVRRGRWKLVLDGALHDGTPGSNKSLTGEDAIFLSDLETDPGETTNLRRRHPAIVDELTTSLGQWSALLQ